MKYHIITAICLVCGVPAFFAGTEGWQLLIRIIGISTFFVGVTMLVCNIFRGEDFDYLDL